MKITIAQRLKPFSHTPGAKVVIPGTHFVLEAFPALLRIGNLEIPLDVPVRDFTVSQDLEKNCVWVSRNRISASPDGFEILFGKERKFFPIKIAFSLPEHMERLSLGSHKTQDWDLVLRRFDLLEILPVLYALGQKIPPLPPQPHTGTARLLDFPDETAFLGLEILCRAAFHHILVPRLSDDQHQGLCPDEEGTGNSFYLIQESARRIRSLFFRQEGNRLSLLPSCPFAAGRMTGVQTTFGPLDLEWAKGILRRAVLHASMSGEVALDLQKAIKTFRLRLNTWEKGRKRGPSETFLVEAGKTYLLDRFQMTSVRGLRCEL
jgi:hypothetical protein